MADAEDLNDDIYEKYIGAKLITDKKYNNGGNLETVTRRSTDEYGAPIVRALRNPMLDTRKFEVKLEIVRLTRYWQIKLLLTFIPNWTMRAVIY